MYLKKWDKFNESINKNKMSKIEDIVDRYLSKSYGIIGCYGKYNVKKESGNYIGYLFSPINPRYKIGIRINWEQTEKEDYVNAHSIDLWKNLEMYPKLNQPSYTFELNGGSLAAGLKAAVDRLHEFKNELYSNIDGKIPEKEEAEKISLMDLDEEDFENIEIDVFELLKEKVKQIAVGGYGVTLIVTGLGGLGKSFDVKKSLEEAKEQGFFRDKYRIVKGSVTTSGLYELLFRERNSLIVFDDCDSVFKTEDSVNILKGALDSEPEREISRINNRYFETDNMTMNDILANYEGKPSLADNPSSYNEKNKGKYPQSFTYTGRIIFISNLSIDKIDPTIITRASAHIDVDLTHDEVIDRVNKVVSKIKPEVSHNIKQEVIDFIDYMTQKYNTKHPLNIRTVLNGISTRLVNDGRYYDFKGKKVPLWQVMLKQDLMGKKRM
jgi:hypothetical protein